MAFSDLETLRRYLAELSDLHVVSLSNYYDEASGGFVHKHQDVGKKPAGDPSKASTATCVLSLTACGKWKTGKWAYNSAGLVRTLLMQKWESAELEENNPFTVAWILEAVTALQEFDGEIEATLDEAHKARIVEAENILVGELKRPEHPGGASIAKYPPSAYVTQLAVRVLRKRCRLDDETAQAVKKWAWAELQP